MYKIAFLHVSVLLCALASPLAAQLPVAQAPPIKFQFFSNAGLPLAGGCLSTFQAGTSNLAATYTESTGTSLNTNPIILDGAGRADIFLPNAAFKFTMKSAGGVNCATGSTLWTVDGITGVLGLLNLNNIWTGTNTFNQPIVIAVNSNQIVAGSPGAQTTLNFPAPAGNVTLNFPSIADTVLGLKSTCTPNTAGQYLRDNGTQLGCSVLVASDNVKSYTNEGVTGTTLNLVVKLTGAPSTAVRASNLDTTGAIGICVSGCGIGGTGQIATFGLISCGFDGATTANDYVQMSTVTGGQCHDAGATYPTNGADILGRVLSTNGGSGTYQMDFWAAEVKAPVLSTIGVFASNLTGQAANIVSTTLTTPGANGFYRISCYVVETQAATTSSTLPVCAVLYTDADSNVAETLGLTLSSANNVLGQIGSLNTVSPTITTFFAKSGVAIQFNTSGYASVGGTPMQYAVHVRLEGPI